MPTRCAWVTSDPLYIDYHDHEWGRPVYDDRQLFEFLTLEGAQAGLNWITVLKRRAGYRQAFAEYDLDKIIQFDDAKVAELMQNSNIIRHQGKIRSVIGNAHAALTLKDKGISLSDFFWTYVEHQPITNHWHNLQEVPTQTTLSEQIAKDMKRLGFTFFGSTICYAFMQAIGMVNDHTTDCFCHPS
jgi:DNA-3-methyladenine glycosylase I